MRPRGAPLYVNKGWKHFAFSCTHNIPTPKNLIVKLTLFDKGIEYCPDLGHLDAMERRQMTNENTAFTSELDYGSTTKDSTKCRD